MAYQANKPQPTDRLKDSVADLEGNFQALKTLVDVNHGTFGSINEGKHEFVTFPEQGAAPAVPGGTDVNMYLAVSAGSSNANDFFIQRSAGADVPFSAALKLNNGWTYLPSGIIMQWGNGSAGVSGSGSTTQSFIFTFPTNCLSVQLTPFTGGTVADQNTFVQLISRANNQFTYFYSGRTTANAPSVVQFTWLAIGF